METIITDKEKMLWDGRWNRKKRSSLGATGLPTHSMRKTDYTKIEKESAIKSTNPTREANILFSPKTTCYGKASWLNSFLYRLLKTIAGRYNSRKIALWQVIYFQCKRQALTRHTLCKTVFLNPSGSLYQF